MTTLFSSRVLELSIAPSTGFLLPVVAACLIVSVISAFVPARRAAGLDPTEVLREE